MVIHDAHEAFLFCKFDFMKLTGERLLAFLDIGCIGCAEVIATLRIGGGTCVREGPRSGCGIRCTLSNVLEPRERKVLNPPADSSRKLEGDAFTSDTMGEFDILSNGIEERVRSMERTAGGGL